MTEITEGTELYWPPERFAPERTITVTKVGRKWLTLSNRSRADCATLRVDTSSGSGVQLYRSKAEWEESKNHRRLWQDFKNSVERCYGTPPASKEDIKKAAAILGLNINAVNGDGNK